MLKNTKRLLILTASVMIVASGCGQAKQNPVISQNGASGTAAAPSASPSVAPSVTPQAQEQQVKVYYGNEEGSGLTESTETVRYTTPSSKYLGALNALKQTRDPKAVPLCANFSFKTAELKDGNLTVDLSFTESDQLGSNGESLLMQALPKTLFQFEEVKTIELLVDGKKKDSLMGHVDLPHPITR